MSDRVPVETGLRPPLPLLLPRHLPLLPHPVPPLLPQGVMGLQPPHRHPVQPPLQVRPAFLLSTAVGAIHPASHCLEGVEGRVDSAEHCAVSAPSKIRLASMLSISSRTRSTLPTLLNMLMTCSMWEGTVKLDVTMLNQNFELALLVTRISILACRDLCRERTFFINQLASSEVLCFTVF